MEITIKKINPKPFVNGIYKNIYLSKDFETLYLTDGRLLKTLPVKFIEKELELFDTEYIVFDCKLLDLLNSQIKSKFETYIELKKDDNNNFYIEVKYFEEGYRTITFNEIKNERIPRLTIDHANNSLLATNKDDLIYYSFSIENLKNLINDLEKNDIITFAINKNKYTQLHYNICKEWETDILSNGLIIPTRINNDRLNGFLFNEFNELKAKKEL